MVTRTFITLRLLGELGEVDRIFTRLGHIYARQLSTTTGRGHVKSVAYLVRSSRRGGRVNKSGSGGWEHDLREFVVVDKGKGRGMMVGWEEKARSIKTGQLGKGFVTLSGPRVIHPGSRVCSIRKFPRPQLLCGLYSDPFFRPFIVLVSISKTL